MLLIAIRVCARTVARVYPPQTEATRVYVRWALAEMTAKHVIEKNLLDFINCFLLKLINFCFLSGATNVLRAKSLPQRWHM